MDDTTSPDVEVIIPARDAALTIERTLRSLAPDRNVIVRILLIDDGSADGTGVTAYLAAKKYNLPLSVVRTEAGSAGAARNIGLDQVKADFIYFIDADDEVVPGGLTVLRTLLNNDPQAGISVGMTIRRSKWRKDLLKYPRGFGANLQINTERYLRNTMQPIAMGSAMVRLNAVGIKRFPKQSALDEDTVFWSRLLWRNKVVTTEEPILVYHLDLERMEGRFTQDPGRAFKLTSDALLTLLDDGIPPDWIDRRISWVSLRFARQLIMAGRYREARDFVSRARQSPHFSRSWKVIQYSARILAGRFGLKRSTMTAVRSPKTTPQRFMLVTHDPIFPPVSGYDHRNWSIASALAERGNVHLVSVVPTKSPACLPDNISMADLSETTRATGRTKDVRSAELLAKIHSWKPDTVIFAGMPLLYLMKAVRSSVGTLVVDMHNVESALVRALSRWSGGASKFSAWRRWRRTFRHEREALALADQVWCCSRLDRDRLYELHKGRPDIAIVPNSMPWLDGEFAAKLDSTNTGPEFLYAGHLDYLPNKLAVSRLVANIMPLIRAKIPNAKLVLAGRSPPKEIVALVDPGRVDVIANPPDMGQLLRRSSASIMPITEGGGTRIKVLECMAAKVPVVATSLAVEGLDIRADMHFLLSETDAELADNAITACEKTAQITRMREAAFDLVQASFGREAVVSHIEDALFQ